MSRPSLSEAELEQTLRDCAGALWAADSAAPRLAEGGQHARPDPMAAAGTAGTQAAARGTAPKPSPTGACCGSRKPIRCCSARG